MVKRFLDFYRRKFWSGVKYGRLKGVKIGKDCWIRTKDFGSEPYLIAIGDHVQITHGVMFFTHGASWVLREKHSDFDFFGKIQIGNNVYIGVNSIILPGVVIGNDVVIGAGSVVTKSVPNGVIVGGNPAKVIGNIAQFEAKLSPFNLKTKGLSYTKKREYLLKIDEAKFVQK